MKVMTFVGTRPEVIKLSRVIAELDGSVSHFLVHSGQNHDYELNQIFFDELEIRRPDAFLEAAEDSPMRTIGNVLIRGDEILEQQSPDGVLVLGDTNSCLVAIAAKRRRVPVFHMEAGNRCFDQRVPEEINRTMVDHVSDVNLTYSEHARRYLLQEGMPPDRVIKTGSPMREVLMHYRPRIDGSGILKRLGLTARGYFVLSAHREENVDVPERIGNLVLSVNELARRYRMPIIFSVHPRTRRRLDAMADLHLDSLVRVVKPLGFIDYAKLQADAYCVLSDSGTITEECALLGFPAVTIRQTHERPEGMDEATLVMADLIPDRIATAVQLVTDHAWRDGVRFREPPDYAPTLVSKQVVRIIVSYIDYVRRTVWQVTT